MENKNALLKNLVLKYSQFREDIIVSRYLTYSHIEPLLEEIREHLILNEIGRSFNDLPIHSVTLGKGKIKILAWSQMHGNESTTTKALFDLFNAFILFPEDPLIKIVKEKVTLKVIPMLNPDGALRYTRENANNTDLNRDALRLKEKESKFLRNTFKEFDPDFCLNLHDQRTIFSAGDSPHPATLSFLTPAMDENRNIYPERKVSMQLTASIVSDLRFWLPNGIGRYSDEFNPNCTGDTFQSLGKPTILFEAGHFPEDYKREVTRKHVTSSLLSTLFNIAQENWKDHNYMEYFEIPENNKLFFDVILRDAMVEDQLVDIALQYKEVLMEGDIIFQPSIEKIENSINSFGHREIFCRKLPVTLENKIPVRENVVVKNIYLNNEVLAINYQNI